MSGVELRLTYQFSEGEVRYDVSGDGPPIVLVHGTPWSSFTWRHVVPILARRYRVYYYDLIGYGQSEKCVGQRVAINVQSQLLTELLQHWKLNSPHVVAHDIGGAIALRAHLLNDLACANLVLVNVVAVGPWGSHFFTHVQKYESAFRDAPAYIHKAIVEAYLRGALYKQIEPGAFDLLVQPWLGRIGQSAFYRQIAQASQHYTDEIEPNYAHIRCPVLILWGEKDAWIPLADGERLHKAIPHSQFRRVKDAGHLSSLEAPGFVASQVLEFLR